MRKKQLSLNLNGGTGVVEGRGQEEDAFIPKESPIEFEKKAET